MPILAKAPPKTQFEVAPEGLWQAVCVDVIDLQMVDTGFGEQHKVRIVWQFIATTDEDDEIGKRYLAGKSYRLSLHPKATLTKDLQSWRGKQFTEQELEGFDLERLISVNCQIQTVHQIGKDGRIWSNVANVVQAPKGVPKLTAVDYVRHRDRVTGQHAAVEEIPF